MSTPAIGFIGLGLMGGNMVANLQDKGNTPRVLSRNKDAVAKVVARGGLEASSPAELDAGLSLIHI